jgi:hypothetical protein
MEKVRRHTLVFLDFYIFPALISVVSPDPEELKFDVCIQLESPFDSLHEIQCYKIFVIFSFLLLNLVVFNDPT